jgi:ketosteroid isomerase-like protein
MSEQENINLAKKLYNYFTKGDVQNILNMFSDNAELIEPPQGPPPFAGKYKGKNQISTFFKNINEVSSPVTFEAKEYFAKDNSVIVKGHYKFHSKVTHRDWDTDFVEILRIDNNKISKLEIFKDSAAELKALDKEYIQV